MISIIICLREKEISSILKENIERTVGVEYELIGINNSTNQYNIFQAYNIGIQKAKYPYLCFMHDDIRYHTCNWGLNIIKHFEDTTVGMIGISGPTYISSIPGIWWGINNIYKTDSTRQYNIDTDRFNTTQSHFTINNPHNEIVSEVVALDGLFFCIKKDLFQYISFDERYNSFHFYDIDISLQVSALNFRLLCVYDILIEHFSAPNQSTDWIIASRVFFTKWRKILPIYSYNFTHEQIKRMENSNIKTMLDILTNNRVSFVKYYTTKDLLNICIHNAGFIFVKLRERLWEILLD